jgi:hypothetical protein
MRFVTVGFGMAALCWALYCAPIFRASALFEGIARQVIAAEVFPDDALLRMLEIREAFPKWYSISSGLERSTSIVRLRLVESALERVNVAPLDVRMAALRSTLHDAFAINPADSFLWLTLYWLDNTQRGFSLDNLAGLVFSYTLGPREGWIAIRRNRLALPIFSQLDDSTRDLVVAEFAIMVAARMIVETAANLAGPGWPIRERLVARLVDVDTATREALARYLYGQGIRLSMPGIPEAGERPWR